jgi:hypothetical protein
MSIFNTLIAVALLVTNLSAWSLFGDDDELYKGEKTYGLLMAGTGSNENFLIGATLFASPMLTHLEETITIIKDPKRGPKIILESDSYKMLIKDANRQCSVSSGSTPCNMYRVGVAIVQSAIELETKRALSKK